MDLDIPGLLRRARHVADLSQRDLARAAGVTRKVVGSLESGAVADPRVSTLQRLLAAADCSLAVVDGSGAALTPSDDDPRDRAGRRFPGHLDVRPVHDLHDWWGWLHYSSWAHPPLPLHTFDLSRTKRNLRRLTGEQPATPRPDWRTTWAREIEYARKRKP